MSKLKDCPFCGFSPLLKKELFMHFGYATGFYAKVICPNCRVQINKSKKLVARKKLESEDSNVERVKKMMWEHLQEAIKLWNRRVDECF